MKRSVANTVLSLVAFMALLLGLLVHRVLSPTVMTNEQLAENGLFVYDVPRHIQDFSLRDDTGEPFTKHNLAGKWSLLFFGYTYCPDICPITLATIRQFEGLLEKAGVTEPMQVVLVTVDPQRDTPEKLKEYVSYFSKDYLGVTGEYIDIFNLARQLNVAFGYHPTEDGNYLVSHSGEIALINPKGDFHGFFKIPHNPEKMTVNFRSVLATWQQ
jgi:protein SCO1/2